MIEMKSSLNKIIVTNNSIQDHSTNMTRGEIFGYSNAGHIVRNESVANVYEMYWRQLNSIQTPRQQILDHEITKTSRYLMEHL